jgi:hypothetical protein
MFALKSCEILNIVTHYHALTSTTAYSINIDLIVVFSFLVTPQTY